MVEYKIEETAACLLAQGRIRYAPSDETVRRWARQGHFPNAHKVRAKGRGGAWRIPEGDLVAFVKPVPGPKGPRRIKEVVFEYVGRSVGLPTGTRKEHRFGRRKEKENDV